MDKTFNIGGDNHSASIDVRLAVLDASLARGIAELDVRHGEDADHVRKELRSRLEGKISDPT